MLAATFGVVTARPAQAAQTVPYKINFQGRLTDNNGNVLADGSYNVKFRLYTGLTGGSNVWEEDRVYGAPDRRLTVQNGLFNLQFGDITALTPSLFNEATQGDLWLEVELPSPATASGTSPSWTENPMTPRQPLAGAPYAFNSDTLDGLDASAFAQLNPGAQQSGSLNVSGNITTAAALQGATATLTGAGSLTLGTAGPSGNTGALIFNNAAGNKTVTIQAGNTSANYTLTLPTSPASGTQVLQNDGSGNLSWASPGSCADCVLNDSAITATTNTLAPTTDVSALTIRQTSAASPTKSIFAITNAGGTSTYLNVDQTAAITLASGASQDITLTPGSGTINLGASLLKRTAPGTTTLDFNDAANTTLAVTNSGAGLANLTVDGGLSIGSGQTYKVNGVPISSSDLSNNTDLAKLSATSQTFSGTNTFSGAAGIVLSGTVASGGSLLQVAGALSSGSTGGTYIGANPSSFSGDFENFQVNGTCLVKVTALGDQLAGLSQLDGSTTTSSNQNNSSTSLGVANATNFDVGNYVQITSTDCGGTGISPCYAKITAKAGNTLTITPALKWASGAAVVEYHIPELGANDLTSTLANRYGRGYFIAGVATGNGTTYYNEDGITSSLSSFSLLPGVSSLTLGDSSTTLTAPGSLAVTGTISAALLQSGSGTLSLGSTTSLTASGALSIDSGATANLSLGAGANAKTVTLGNTTGATTVTIDTGTGGLSLGDDANTKTINIGGVANGGTDTIKIGTNATGADAITIGSTNAASTTGLTAGALSTTNNIGVYIGGGYSTSDATQVSLLLDSTTTFAEAANTCTSSVNGGALYYNATSNSVRACVAGTGWSEVLTAADLGLLTFGVVPDSGPTPGDWVGINGTLANTGPCKVYMGSTNSSVRWTGCTAYSGDRRIVVAAQSSDQAVTTGSGVWAHVCLTGTNNQAALTTGAADTENNGLPTFSATAPVLCLADISTTNTGGGKITGIYDTRTFTTSAKEIVNNTTATPGLGQIYVQSTTAGQVNKAAATAGVGLIRGVAVAVTGNGGAQTANAMNMIIATAGPAYVKATAGTVGSYAQAGATTAGYAATSTVSANGYGNLGIALSAFSSTCTASTDTCRASLAVDLRLR